MERVRLGVGEMEKRVGPVGTGEGMLKVLSMSTSMG